MSTLLEYDPAVLHPNAAIQLISVPAETVYDAGTLDIPGMPAGTVGMELDVRFAHRSAIKDVIAYRRNEHHKRSLELRWQEMPDDMGSVTLKGGSWNKPALYSSKSLDAVEYSGGMLWEDARKALDASTFLEEAGVHGERIERIDFLEFLPYQGDLLPASTVISKLVRHGNFSVPVISKLGARFLFLREEFAPVAVFRRSPTDIRLDDFATLVTKERLLAYVATGMARVATLLPDFAGMDPTVSSDVWKFFTNALPRAYGRQLGSLAAGGYYQMYPHSGNIAIDGGIVDLDGITRLKKDEIVGKELGYKFLLNDGVLAALQSLRRHSLIHETRLRNTEENFLDAYSAAKKTLG